MTKPTSEMKHIVIPYGINYEDVVTVIVKLLNASLVEHNLKNYSNRDVDTASLSSSVELTEDFNEFGNWLFNIVTDPNTLSVRAVLLTNTTAISIKLIINE